MPTLQIGRKQIPYELRRSARASERRITITPGHVDVLVLKGDDDDDVAEFLKRKRQWIFNTLREMDQATSTRHAVPRLATGSKIPFRGRKMPLTVRRTDLDRAAITYRNGFLVDLPCWASHETDVLVASELRHWLKQRCRQDSAEIAERYAKRFGLIPASLRVADLSHGWGSCGQGGNITINWHLIMAPRRVLEYVIVHELAHLKVRSHADDFWNFLSLLFPQYQECRDWLEKNAGALNSDFLGSA